MDRNLTDRIVTAQEEGRRLYWRGALLKDWLCSPEESLERAGMTQ